MDMMVKREINDDKRRVLSVATGATEGSDGDKCIKRRRRQPALAPIATNGNREVMTVKTIKRSSRFRGVSRHRWTGKFEAHLWDKVTWNATQRKKGKQVYLGAYDEEESAARAYDMAALKYWGPTTITNFPVTDYEQEIEIMQNVTKEEYLASLRRKSSGFSRGVSKYRGVARHHHNGKWEARIGRAFGNKYLYLGTYGTQEQAAHAYDLAAIEYRGTNAVTNFNLSTYIRWLRPGIYNALNNPREPQLNNLFPTNGDAQPLANRRPFTVDELQLPCKQEFVPYQTPGSKSSPTALDLLLRSSMFQQLVENNSSAPDEDIDGEDAKDVYNGILYDEGTVDMTVEINESTPYIWNGVLGIQ